MMWKIFAIVGLDFSGWEQKVAEGVGLMVVGMGVVFAALMIIGMVLGLLGRILRGQPGMAAAESMASSAGAGAAEGPGAGRMDPKLVAVLAAAAAVVAGRPVRIQRITYLNQNTISGWAEMGRIAIHTSHNIRRTR
ncbi:MAG: OadG family protein [Phycisphaeraceae bacterium]|nr:OadG family protein [Phycisphaeraceae bacterium]